MIPETTGAGCFFKNIAEMAPDRPVLLIDLPGFGESERIDFGDDDNPEPVWLDALQRVIGIGFQHKFLIPNNGIHFNILLSSKNEVKV